MVAATSAWIVGVEAGRGPDGLLEDRRAACQQPVQGFLVEDGRDAQARLLQQVTLDLVAHLGNLRGQQVACRRPGG